MSAANECVVNLTDLDIPHAMYDILNLGPGYGIMHNYIDFPIINLISESENIISNSTWNENVKN